MQSILQSLKQHWLSRYLVRAETRISLLLISIVAAVLASLFEMLSLALMLPLLKGLISSDFRFVMELPLLSEVTSRLPGHFPHGNRNFIILLVSITFGAVLAKVFFQYLSNRVLYKVVRRLENRLRQLVFERLLKFGKLYFDTHSVGKLQQVLIGYTQQVASALFGLQGVMFAVFTLLAYGALMLWISWELTLIVLCLFPILHFSLSGIIRGIRVSSGHYADSFNVLTSELSNSLGAIPLIKAYTSQREESSAFDRNSNEVERLHNTIDRRILFTAPVQEIITILFLFLVVGVICLLMVKEGEWRVAEYMVFLMVLRRSATSFGLLNQMRSTFASVSGAVRELDSVFDDEDKPFIYEGDREFSGLTDSITLRNLRFDYPGGYRAVDDVSLEIKRGQVLALVGQSGAGKSSIVHLLMRFYDPPASSIFADGTDIREFTLRSWRKHIAFIGQDSVLVNATLRKNVTYGLEKSMDDTELRRILEEARLGDLLNKLPEGLDTIIGERGVKLSGGERQRVAIARAIAKDAQILLLDEATSALDSETERLVQDALNTLMHNRTAVVIAHRLSTIKRADSIVVLEDGKILERGRFDDLLSREAQFHRLWNAQTMLV